jgi:hypothetical protein
MPKVTTPRTWPGSGLLAAGVVAVLLLVVVGLYAMGGGEGGGSNQSLFGPETVIPETGIAAGAALTPTQQGAVVRTTPEPTVPAETAAAETPSAPVVVPVGTLPDLRGQTSAEAMATLRSLSLNYLLVQVRSDLPSGQVIRQQPAPGSEIGPDQVVTLEVSRGS